MRIKFHDQHPAYNVRSHYAVTNEEPEMFKQMLGDRRFKRAGGIASGGEMLFALLLPRSDEVVLVDHSYKSLLYLLTKGLLLEELGREKTVELIAKGTKAQIKAEFKRALTLLPYTAQMIQECNISWEYEFSYLPQSLNKEWSKMDPADLDAACEKLDKVLVIHGDLQDLAPHGPFDLLYTSNALEHSGRNGPPTAASFHRLLAEDGTLICTGAIPYEPSYYSPQQKEAVRIPAYSRGLHWPVTAKMRGVRSSWDYHVAQKGGGC